MRLLLLLTFWSLLLISCKEVTFIEAQPAGITPLKEIPPALYGLYQTYDRQTGETGDTLIIESWGYHFKDKEDQDWLGRGTLSDSLVVKFYQNYYFVNFKDGDQWVLRLIRENSPGVLEFMSIDIQDDSKRREILRKLSRKMEVKEIQKGDDTFYQIQPTPTQLVSLIKEGYFTGVELRKMK
jgi:hypothetical protein